jgi:dUTP pyrophosphatase
MTIKVKYKKLSSKAVVPKFAHSGDAGADLISVSIRKTDTYDEHLTGLSVEIPEGHVGLIFPRSSISNYELRLKNAVAVIDSGYRGEISLRFKKTSNFGNYYKVGDRVGQLVIIEIPKVEFEEIKLTTVTDRNSGSYGSSGN